MNGLISENFKIVKGLAPSADINNGDPATGVFNIGNASKVIILCHQNSTSTGTATITVEACTDFSATGATAIPFYSREVPDGTSDTASAITATAATGLTTTAGADVIKLIEVLARDVPVDSPYLRVKLTEVVNAAVIGSVTIMLESRVKSSELPTAIA